MRLLGVLGVLCVLVVPATAGTIDLTEFTVTNGTLTIDTTPDEIASPDPAVVSLGGTFSAAIDSSDMHLDASDTVLLGACALSNTELVTLTLASVATALIQPGDVKFTEFLQPTPAHMDATGAGVIQSDAAFEALIVVDGMGITFSTATSAGELLDFTFTVSPVSQVLQGSNIVTMNLGGTFVYEIEVSEINATLTLDLVIDVTGTAHVVPDPAFGGLTALGLAGAGAWLRRRS